MSFLYGESNDVEARDFEGHLKLCRVCAEELASFGHIRESIGNWKEDALNNFVQPQVVAPVRQKSALVALREFFNELTAIGKPVPADELTKAKNYIAFGFPSNFETIGDFSAQMEQLLVYGLPESYYADYVKNIQAVTADAVLKMAATYIQPQRFLVVVVGDRKVIEPGIRALNLGMVRTMSVQEALGE